MFAMMFTSKAAWSRATSTRAPGHLGSTARASARSCSFPTSYVGGSWWFMETYRFSWAPGPLWVPNGGCFGTPLLWTEGERLWVENSRKQIDTSTNKMNVKHTGVGLLVRPKQNTLRKNQGETCTMFSSPEPSHESLAKYLLEVWSSFPKPLSHLGMWKLHVKERSRSSASQDESGKPPDLSEKHWPKRDLLFWFSLDHILSMAWSNT